MKKITKKEQQLLSELTKLNLTHGQVDGIIKLYRKTKEYQVSVDQGYRFSEINSGKKVRDFVFACTAADKKKRGIYKITFDGSKFYIGRSKYIGERWKQHEKLIRKYFTDKEVAPNHYLTKVFAYLESEPMAYFLSLEVIEECVTVDELLQKEQKWLNKFKDSPNCLNLNFIAAKPYNEIDETLEEQIERKGNTGVARRGGRFIFYPKKKIESAIIGRRVESLVKSTPKKKESATSFSFNVPEIESDLGHSVFKLYCGDRYIIHKGKSLAGSIFLLQKGCGYFLAYDHHKESQFDKDYYNSFYDYVRKNTNKPFKVDILLTSDDPYEILVKEQVELNNAIRDKKCLNQNLKGYIPTFNPKTNMHGWITVEQVNRFYDFLAAM